MSFQLPAGARSGRTRPAWSGMAVVVEAMLMLVFLIGSLAILTQVFATASVRAREAHDLAAAVSVATSAAERFAADPEGAEGVTEAEGLSVDCQVTSDQTTRGTIYHATITVRSEHVSEPVYTLSTERYVEGGQ